MRELTKDNLIPVHTALTVEDGTARVAKIDKDLPDENTYVKIAGVDFHNGTIEVDVCGGLLPGLHRHCVPRQRGGQRV